MRRRGEQTQSISQSPSHHGRSWWRRANAENKCQSTRSSTAQIPVAMCVPAQCRHGDVPSPSLFPLAPPATAAATIKKSDPTTSCSPPPSCCSPAWIQHPEFRALRRPPTIILARPTVHLVRPWFRAASSSVPVGCTRPCPHSTSCN